MSLDMQINICFRFMKLYYYALCEHNKELNLIFVQDIGNQVMMILVSAVYIIDCSYRSGRKPTQNTCTCIWNEPQHDKTNKVVCAPSEDQSLRCLHGSLASHWAHKQESDQTGGMPSIIWVFAGCTCHLFGFVMLRLNIMYLIFWPYAISLLI